ncbi:hypothetical protein K437DRAFT_259095 [Tilletiaria anomala UBC 951]|uniref:U4/U6.U5 small nuclear ribonucleoprotein 27kDa protein domain-containing protein n=1 Tax=Tilletiaria anomala (strain ATCC 24038 / CBS 436.72 / UBC 951) TaxID=1037660 RepID=A0A066VKX4_TILAU|nr:uncharacterized protein K437DRAFT_259095 [Tilletiaria anomala UBC 951]KDN39404.1 hypothetical protein K437DRAFT_259095 [Tilletiaria anomala UBC 951]
MMAAMGFGGFGTTKGKKIDDASQLGYAKIKQERTWRQYMNRYALVLLTKATRERCRMSKLTETLFLLHL